MKELQKKFLNIGLAPYSIPVTVSPGPGHLPAQHAQYQMTNYLLGPTPGLQLHNSSDLLTFYSNNGTTLYNGNLEKSVSGYQISGDIAAPAPGYTPLTAGTGVSPGGLAPALAPYQTLATPYLGNPAATAASLSSLLISNSIPQLQNIQVQNMPIISHSSSLSKSSGLQTLLPVSSSPSDKLRSSLLESFRSNQVSVLGLSDLTGHVLEFAQDQHGSRFIQQKLETATKDEKSRLWEEIAGSQLSLMTDVFGNYVIQKFVEHGSEEQQRSILMTVLPNMDTLTIQMYGCRVIQKLLDNLHMEQKKILFRKLEPKIEEFIRDHNGNHVIQKCIEVMEVEDKQVILNRYDDKYVELSCHPYGCRIVQRLLEHCGPAQTERLLLQLLARTDQLLLDQYGNYVIQHVLDHGVPANKARIIARIEGRVLMLSQHKFASNVVEKCVSNASCEERSRLIAEVCEEDTALGAMIRDQYGNYVVQKMIDTAADTDLGELMAKIKIHSSSLHKFSYGKYILAKLENFYRSEKWK